MSTISNRLLNNRWVLSILSGISVFIAFERFSFIPAIFFFPLLFNQLIQKLRSIREALLFGFFTSFIIMLGGFYWITYVVHEFGHLSWFLSGLLFICFCGFGALNFPIFSAIAFLTQSQLEQNDSKKTTALWFTLGLPALFTVIEWGVPKLFPWYIGHSLYKQNLLIQICEFTGASFLTFSIYSLGSTLWAVFLAPADNRVNSKKLLLIPFTLLAIQFTVGIWTRWFRVFPDGRELRVALIQANIGNIDKVAAYAGSLSRVDTVMNTYQSLTRQALSQKPDLILWPETAVPFRLDLASQRQSNLESFIRDIGVPLITGGYATNPADWRREYNAAFLLDPKASELRKDIYYKNILLAFGEYLPLGETFPKLYEWFPEVSDFQRGDSQKRFALGDNVRLGLSICYESIVPAFMRKVANQEIHAFINLTNDSWFGPTSEPFLHAALTVFRAIEHRVPFVRVTNTGTSFVVDRWGQLSKQTGIYRPEVLVETISLPKHLQQTVYGHFGDWFVYLLAILATVLLVRARN